eukprot:TRINITY_DN33586_c0_g1_i1.p1 TRINITY_DN33586_c0_g1~~TRINITY_DN33586_c0_g1_i1.p1  ORF type:complete len:317 (+),score=31.61 TRINITY_DN33586_c0_g1_i1:59-1009(+)
MAVWASSSEAYYPAAQRYVPQGATYNSYAQPSDRVPGPAYVQSHTAGARPRTNVNRNGSASYEVSGVGVDYAQGRRALPSGSQFGGYGNDARSAVSRSGGNFVGRSRARAIGLPSFDTGLDDQLELQLQLEAELEGVEDHSTQRAITTAEAEHLSSMPGFNRREWTSDPFYGWRTQDASSIPVVPALARQEAPRQERLLLSAPPSASALEATETSAQYSAGSRHYAVGVEAIAASQGARESSFGRSASGVRYSGNRPIAVEPQTAPKSSQSVMDFFFGAGSGAGADTRTDNVSGRGGDAGASETNVSAPLSAWRLW